jgi:outer membrane protein OmpA-like peptidoglycan-associated protein
MKNFTCHLFLKQSKAKFLLLGLFIGFVTQIQAQRVPPEKYQLKIKVADVDTNEDLDGAYVKLYNITKKKIADSSVVIGGYVTFMLEKGNDYDLIGSRARYMARRANFNAACYLKDPNKVFCVSGIVLDAVNKLDEKTDQIEGTMNMKKISINQTFKVENIYYDLNKWAIRPEAGKELDKLVVILKDNPDIIVELGSHTDCRASDEYNLNLSQKRAESAVAYIISKGIGKDRITAKGYGETKLLNKCDDGIPCTEIEHQTNRRTEVKITGYLVNGQPVDLKGGAGAVSGGKQ